MAFDKLYIANRMLVTAGESSIEALGTGDKAQRLIKLFYDGFVLEVFSFNIPWHFATTRLKLAEVSTTPAFGWAHQFYRPEACIQIIKTVDENAREINYPYEPESILVTQNRKKKSVQVLLTDQESMFVKYKYLLADPAGWPGWFQRLVILYGAMQLVAPVMKDDFTAMNVQRQYTDAYSKAKGANGAEGMDTGDNEMDLDMGNSDIVNAMQDSERLLSYNRSSLNRA